MKDVVAPQDSAGQRVQRIEGVTEISLSPVTHTSSHLEGWQQLRAKGRVRGALRQAYRWTVNVSSCASPRARTTRQRNGQPKLRCPNSTGFWRRTIMRRCQRPFLLTLPASMLVFRYTPLRRELCSGTFMKRTLVLAAILILSCTFVAQQQQNQTRYPKAVYIGPAGPLTVNDVIELSRAGVHDERIIAELEKNTQSFHLTSNDVTRLKHAGVSQSVIQAMIDVPFSPGAQASAPAGTASPAGVKPASTTQPGGVSAQPPNSPPAVNSPPLSEPAQPALPTEPGLYVLSGQSRTKILGQPVTFERSGSKLKVSGLTLSIKAAHSNVPILPRQHGANRNRERKTYVRVSTQPA